MPGRIISRVDVALQRPNKSVANEPTKSRLLSRRSDPASVAQPPQTPYRWIEPITWQDGAVYSGAELTKQLSTNVAEIPYCVGLIKQEDFTIPPDTFELVDPELFISVRSGEVWYLEAILYLVPDPGAGMEGGWSAPQGSKATGYLPFQHADLAYGVGYLDPAGSPSTIYGYGTAWSYRFNSGSEFSSSREMFTFVATIRAGADGFVGPIYTGAVGGGDSFAKTGSTMLAFRMV